MRAFSRCLVILALFTAGCAGPGKPVGVIRQEAIVLNDTGYSYYRQSRFRLAQEKFQQALKLNRLIDHRPGIAANLNNLGAIAQEQGHLDQALVHFQEALAIQQEVGDPAGICEGLNNLGTVYQARGNWQEARRLYREALGWAEMLPPGPLLTLTLTHLGDAARHEGDYQDALTLYQQALKIDEAHKDRRGQAVRWERLGRTYLALQDFSQAYRFLHRALAEARRLESTPTIIDALDGLTRLALAQGDRPTARLYGERLINLYQARGQTDAARQLEALLK